MLFLINGNLFRDSILSASNNIGNYRKSVDALNVFPVPDGDTGTNMSMTMAAAARELERLKGDELSVGDVAAAAASALLRGARGNSGVILSLIFRGIGTGLKGKERADASAFASALIMGVDNAYKAVMKPTEGTILTVVRLFAKEAVLAAERTDSLTEVWSAACKAGQAALEDTPNILPVLMKAGVVDAGGQGLMHIFRGMESVFAGNGIILKLDSEKAEEPAAPVRAGETDEEIRFAYCTEFLINRRRETAFSPVKLRAYLESVGDCVVVVDDDTVVKVHCHSNEPGNILQMALRYGALINIKIENMRQQHEDASWGAAPKAEALVPAEKTVAAPEKPFGIVAIASGKGLEDIFRSIGADSLVSGGQTMNPSTDDILSAIESTPAKEVFVLPNNRNIIMAAEQTVPLSDKTVRVLQTRTIPEGIAAALVFDENALGEENHMAMMKAAENVSTALVTYAARDSQIGSQTVSKGRILGMENGKITVVEDSPVQAAYRTVKHLVKKGTSVITVYYGEDVTEKEAEELVGMLKTKFGKDCEISALSGGQPVYYYVISVE